MADEYELKQVKVRLKLAEAEPLYSTEQITTPDKAAEVMAQALSQMDREYCCVVNLDGANHPINFNVVSIGDVNQAHVPIQNVFKSAILSNASSIMMFHNHPSGSVQASREDIDVTKRLIEAGKIMNIPVLDHIIVGGGTAERFSFKEANPEMFKVKEEAEYSVHEPQAKLDPDSLMVRPTYRNFGVYEKIGENRARVLFEGTEEECRNKIRELSDRYRASEKGDSFTIYQLKDDESLHGIRFERLEHLNADNKAVEKENYDKVYEGPLKPGTTLDDIYYEFNMQRPIDFRGHSLSVSDMVVLHQGGEDKAFYVDSFGFAEIPDFLIEKEVGKEVETIESLTNEKDRLLGELLEAENAVERFMLETGGSSDRSDEMQENVAHLRSELDVVEKKLDNLYEQMEEDAFGDEVAYKLGDRFISIQRTDEGFDYSIYDEAYHLLDGGVYDNPEATLGEVLEEITGELKAPVYDPERDRYMHTKIQGNIKQSDVAVRVDFDELEEKAAEVGAAEIGAVKEAQNVVDSFREKTEQAFHAGELDGMRPSEIESLVKDRVQQVIDDYGIDARIEDVIVSGSRCRGLEKEGSDIDVVVSFSGGEREDDLFNILHEEKLFLSAVELDINPISVSQTGTLAEYLPGVETFLSEKAAQMVKENVTEYAQAPKQVITFTVAESSEFHSFGELHEGIPTLQDAIEVYEKLKHESSLNGIPGLGINVHTVGTEKMDDLQWDFMTGNTIDLEGLMYMPEMSQNEEVVEALHQLADKYPEAEIIGRFPDEPKQSQPTFGHDVQKSEELTAQSLAEQLNQFAYDYDLYEYRDSVEDPEAHIAMLKNDIENGTTEGITSYLQEIVDQEDGLPEDLEKARELLAKLAEYKPLAKVEEREEQNYNMIDNVLNNLPQDPEEKKEPAPQKEMRMAEVKKVRKRVSMKKLLAEKKVEVAEREKKPPEVGAPSKRPSMGVDD